MTALKRLFPQEQTIDVTIAQPRPAVVVGRGIQDSTLYRVRVEIEGVQLPLLKKDFDAAQLPSIRASQILRRHTEIKKRGVPTIPLMFQDMDNPSVLYVSDLTRGGVRECMSTMDWESDGTRHGVRCNDYRLFFLKEVDEVSRGFADLFEVSSRAGVICTHADVYFLVMDPTNGYARTILGDLGQVHLAERGHLLKSVLEANYHSMTSFLYVINKHLDPNQLNGGPLDRRYYDLMNLAH